MCHGEIYRLHGKRPMMYRILEEPEKFPEELVMAAKIVFGIGMLFGASLGVSLVGGLLE